MNAAVREELTAAELAAQVTEDELQAAFAETMREWGHYRTAEGLRFPTLEEFRAAAAGRRTDRGWNTSPLP